MKGNSDPFFTHSPNDGADYVGRKAFQIVGPKPDLDIYGVFENQVNISSQVAPRHVDKNLPKHRPHRGADFVAFHGFKHRSG
jgi:hypothetical protein